MSMIQTRLALGGALALMVSVEAIADLATDSTNILNWGEKTYPQFLSSPEKTVILEDWYYRYYPKTNLYVGINRRDQQVYRLYGNESLAVHVDSVANLLKQAIVPSSPIAVNPNDQINCDSASAPLGVSYAREGNNTRITTNGQCVAFPKTDICLPKSPIANGVSVLKNMSLDAYTLNGISFALPSIAEILEPQIKSAANIKTCVINAPAEFARLNFNLNGCFEVTDRVKDFPSVEGLLTVSPPVTIQIQGTIANQTVADCFNSDATIITNALTHEIWDKKGGIFVKR